MHDRRTHGNAALANACERALVARARNAGTRQQLRTAARAFVRRHRRDEGYLRWVLRGVGASSALAVALLGLAAPVAAVELAPFLLRPTNLDPQDVGGRSTPALADLDGDGRRPVPLLSATARRRPRPI